MPAIEERYRTLVENLLNGVVQFRMEPDGSDLVFVEANATFRAYLGVGVGAVIGKRISEVLPGFRTDDADIYDTYCNVIRTGIPARFDSYSRSTQRWFAVQAYRSSADHATVVFDDVTERKRTELALLAAKTELEARIVQLATSESKFMSAFHSGPAGMALTRVADQCFLEVNARFCAIVGYTRAELIGRSSTELGLIRQQVVTELGGELVRQGGSLSEFELEIIRKDGTTATILGSAQTLELDGEPQRMLTIVDITARKHAELALRESEHQHGLLNIELEARVRSRTAELETTNHELESFSYSISHDLRAPLRAVNGYAQIVLDDFAPQLPAEGQRLLRTMQAAGLRMSALIDDLLRLSRYGRQALRQEPIETNELVATLLEELVRDRTGNPIDLRIGELAPCVADRALLCQVWANLLSNALKYSRDRSPAIIEIGYAEGAYFVRDNGVGFDMQHADRLFGAFQRMHRTDEFEGIGIGLAIVERIVRRHGGRVWAESIEGTGSTFRFTLGS